MYIPKVVTVSSTAVIATITASPLQVPGPSDTPIFSVVRPPTTSPTAVLTAAVRPISVAPIITVTTTATVTTRIPENGSPYPAFNASNYPHQNSTENHDHDHKNSTSIVPVMYSNCTNAVPVLYTSGNRTYSSTIYPYDPKDSRVEVICEGRNAKNETRHVHGADEDSDHSMNTTSLGHERPSLSVASGTRSVPHVGPGGAVYESTLPAETNRHHSVNDENADLVGQGSSSDIKAKRETGDMWTDEHVPAYVKALEKGPII